MFFVSFVAHTHTHHIKKKHGRMSAQCWLGSVLYLRIVFFFFRWVQMIGWYRYLHLQTAFDVFSVTCAWRSISSVCSLQPHVSTYCNPGVSLTETLRTIHSRQIFKDYLRCFCVAMIPSNWAMQAKLTRKAHGRKAHHNFDRTVGKVTWFLCNTDADAKNLSKLYIFLFLSF